ncbi:disease resistance protein RPV1-like isoform X2 [Nymphaea colorata]|nr:disease resistance protein RPV1-like isoform X2 [Nymphaea colorata]
MVCDAWSRHEAKLKLAIIEKVLSKLNWKPFLVAKHPIGIETRVQEVKKMLENGDDDVHVVGIQGMGGLGKTTIAKAVYNDLIDVFSGAHCFISDIREKSGEPNGLVTLEKQLFRDIFGCENISLSNVAHGISLIKERAKRKRVLLVLDDVDSIDQVDALAGESDWFGSGSVIIITTRDEKVLRACNVKQHKIYKPKELNEAQSLELFAHHAFRGKLPQGEYLQLSSEVVAAAGGLPLTLEVLGSLLTYDMDVQKWKDMLKKLQNIPPTKVRQRLKLSYDSLEELEQQIFLDISCFFIGWGRENAIYMWEDSGWFPHLAIDVLVQKSLIKIDEKSGQFQMHDQIRDMGRAIVQGGSPRKPQKQSRVWIYQDSLDLLHRKVPGTLDVEGMEIMPNDKKWYGKCVSAQCFERMCNLRYLYVQHVNFRGTFSCFPTDLKWVFLDNCHFDSPPSDSDFNLEKVVILNLHKTNMAQILINQLRVAAFEKLKTLSFRGVEIKMTPNFTCLPCLVNLTLDECPALTTIDESIGELKSLTYLRVSTCEILEKLPDSICRISSLKVLRLKSCSTLSSLPKRLGDLESLVELKIKDASITTIPESIAGLTNLCKLSVTHCEQLNVLPDSICLLSLLECLNVAHCSRLASLPERLGDLSSLAELELNLTGIEVPYSVGQLINLRKLSARFCWRVSRLPDSICQLSCLEVLDLGLCQKLSSVPERLGHMQSLETLDLSYSGIHTIPNSIGQLTNLRRLSLQQSDCLRELPDSICWLSLLEALYLQWCLNFSSLPERLGDIEKLKILILDQTRIQTIPNSVGRLKNLRVLSLEGCKLLKEVPDSIRQLSSLQQLNVSGTTLEGFEKHISHLAAINELTGSSFELLGLSDQSRKAIKHLRLVDATIEELPDCVGGLESLEKLLLECEMLRALPNSIEQHFRKLTKLEIKSKHLKALPDCIGLLKRLQGLSLECENLKTLPSSIGSLKDMRSLKLYCMKLEVLPDSIGRLGNIECSWIESQNLKTLPNWIESLGRVQDLRLHCEILEAIPDSIIGLKELHYLEVSSSCLKVLPNSIGSLKKVRKLLLNCPNLEKLADSIGELATLSSLEVYSDGLKYLPNSIGFLRRIERLMLKCENLEALPVSMETLKSLTELEMFCNNFSALPDFIGRLENLVSFSFQSKNLKHLRVATGSFARLQDLSLSGCRKLKVLADTPIQETGLAHLPSLQSLHLQDCSSLEYLPQLPSSLCVLDASGCTNLRKVSDVSGLKFLKALRLGGCKWIEYVPGLENIVIHLEELVLPGP